MTSLAILFSAVVIYHADRQTDRQTDRITHRITDTDDRYTHATTVGVNNINNNNNNNNNNNKLILRKF